MTTGYVFEHRCNFDVALFSLQRITSKSVKKSENSLFDPCGYFPVWDLVDGENRREENYGMGVEGFYAVRPCRRTRQNWFELGVGGSAM